MALWTTLRPSLPSQQGSPFRPFSAPCPFPSPGLGFRRSAPSSCLVVCRVSGQHASLVTCEEGNDKRGEHGASCYHDPWFPIRAPDDDDPYAGWGPEAPLSPQAPSNSRPSTVKFKDWLKAGGAICLGIGLLLGSRLIYLRRGTLVRGLVSLPSYEQVIVSDNPLSMETEKQFPEVEENIMEESRKRHVENDMPSHADGTISVIKIGRVVVPATVDHNQEKILAALQALKVIEPGVESTSICTRREYARWLIKSSGALTRSSRRKVFPTTYIENFTQLAYDDVKPEDPDFPFIQGLAEAGLLSSRLTNSDRSDNSGSNGKGSTNAYFMPDGVLTRQDLICWKHNFDGKDLLSANKKELIGKTGFFDIEKVDMDAWPALLADISVGDRSIAALAFGYTRILWPQYPVTKAQAAVALASGEMIELLTEEVARLDAESAAETAVKTEMALEEKARREVDAALKGIVDREEEKRRVVEKQIDQIQIDIEEFMSWMEQEKTSTVEQRTDLELEKELFSTLRQQVEHQIQALTHAKVALDLERERLQKLRMQLHQEKMTFENIMPEIHAEKKGLTLARSWAEAEAQKAHALVTVIEKARKWWEDNGIQILVDKEIDATNIPGPSWHYSQRYMDPLELPRMEFSLQLRNFHRVASQAFTSRCIPLQIFAKEYGNRASQCVEMLKKTMGPSVANNLKNAHHFSKWVSVECKDRANKIAQNFRRP